MKNIKFILLLLLIACTTVKTNSGKRCGSYYEYKDYVINIISSPTGAVIEWNNNYIGKTPTQFVATGKLGNYVSATVKAYPISAGQHVQYKVVKNPLPRTIYFDMNLVPVNKGNINIEINQ